jgi:hypothetical protein
MKRRSLQLVCLALLLSTLSLTDSPAVAQANFQMQCSYLRVLGDYGRLWTAARQQQPKPGRGGFDTALAPVSAKAATRTHTLPPADKAAVETAWDMRPPSAQYAALQSFTGFGRERA